MRGGKEERKEEVKEGKRKDGWMDVRRGRGREDGKGRTDGRV